AMLNLLTTAWTNDNPGCRFNGCGLYKLQGRNRCRFFTGLMKR
ncbi:hypothetical protein A2U01_0063188, partial [Trifolium medium]|nr:hypothetical protein [Trifolium medium]